MSEAYWKRAGRILAGRLAVGLIDALVGAWAFAWTVHVVVRKQVADLVSGEGWDEGDEVEAEDAELESMLGGINAIPQHTYRTGRPS